MANIEFKLSLKYLIMDFRLLFPWGPLSYTVTSFCVTSCESESVKEEQRTY